MGRVSRRVRVWGVRVCACLGACVCVCLCLFVGEPGLFGRDLLHYGFVCDGLVGSGRGWDGLLGSAKIS